MDVVRNVWSIIPNLSLMSGALSLILSLSSSEPIYRSLKVLITSFSGSLRTVKGSAEKPHPHPEQYD